MSRLAVVLSLTVVCSACLRSTTVISVRPDGTGTIVQETGFSSEAVVMLKSLAATAEQKEGSPPELFGEEQAKKAASRMGVRFVSGEPIKTAELEGYRAHFAFDDVRTLQMKMNPDPTGSAGGAGEREQPPFGFGFDKRGESAVLTITMPQEKPAAALDKIAPGLGSGAANAEENQQVLQMMKMMMKGLYVDVSLDIDGRIVKTNAPHVEGSRLTLMQIDFDKLLANDAALLKLQSAADLKSLGSVPGLKVLTEPRVTVEFVK